MHFRTHVAAKHKGKSGQGDYNDRMVAHDEHIGLMLDKLDELGIADDTIVLYSTDNGPHYNTWPDGAITPFAHEKDTNWEGSWRVPAFVRWPGKFEAGTVLNGIVSHQDWAETFLAAAGEPAIKEKALAGYKSGDRTFKVHLDGYNMLPYLKGEVPDSPRTFLFYFSDDGDLLAIRNGDWKAVFCEQRAKTMACWAEPFVHLRVPHFFNLRYATRSNVPSRTRTRTGSGWLLTPSCSTGFRRSLLSRSTGSSSTRLARSQLPSTWIRCWRDSDRSWKCQALSPAAGASLTRYLYVEQPG